MQDLVAELARVRRNKIQAGLRELQSALSAVKLLNLGYMEVNQIRPFFKGSLDRFFRLLPARPRLLCTHGVSFLVVFDGQSKMSTMSIPWVAARACFTSSNFYSTSLTPTIPGAHFVHGS